MDDAQRDHDDQFDAERYVSPAIESRQRIEALLGSISDGASPCPSC
jgi:hypothetical protein